MVAQNRSATTDSRKMQAMDCVFSGMQPTGFLTLGNYLGAMRNCVKLQDHAKKAIYFIADMHAITIPQDPEILRQSARRNAAYYIASGISEEKAIIFRQSDMGLYHGEMAWILGCYAKVGWLDRMTQFKEKSASIMKRNKGVEIGFGLYAYPVLMAADILLYSATHVPTGDDQKQHIEFTRDLAISFNHATASESLIVPEIVMMNDISRIMSLRDGLKKMSKSDPSDDSRINLTDANDVIVKKLRHAKTDSHVGIWYDDEKRPEISNLMRIYAALNNSSVHEIADECANMKTLEFKMRVADCIIDEIGDIRDEANKMYADPGYIDGVLSRGKSKAQIIAQSTLSSIKQVVGFN